MNWKSVGFIVGAVSTAGAFTQVGASDGRDLVLLSIATLVVVLLMSLPTYKATIPLERSRPIAVCSYCLMATHHASFIHGVHLCGEGQRGKWITAPALSNWNKCRLCEKTGTLAGRKCDVCDGSGWIFVKDAAILDPFKPQLGIF
jgi:hypothetical protein